MKDQRKAYIFGLTTVLFWSTVATAFKISLRHLDPIQLLFFSSLVSALVLGGITAATGSFRRILHYDRRAYIESLVFGLMNPFLYYVILFKAYDLLPAQEAQPINYTWAVTLTLLSIPLLKQKISARDLIAVLVSYSGVVVISTHGDVFGLHFSDPWGTALALVSTVVWALYWIFNTKDSREPVPGLFLNFLFGLPFIFAACLIFSDPFEFNLPGLLGATYVGVFEMGVTFVLWLKALKYSENTAKVGNLIFISPFLSLVLIHFLVGEEILPSTFVGLVLIIAGLLIQQLRRRRRGV